MLFVHRLLAWIAAHPETAAVAVITFGLVLWKRLPPAQRATIEARMPRAVNAVRVLYALFPDLVKAAYAAAAVVRTPQPPSDGAGPTGPYRASPSPPSSPSPPTAARVGLAAIALAMVLVGGALAASCSGSWEQRAHRALIVTAHVVSATDAVAAQRYQTDVAGQTGAAFERTDDAYRRVQGAESVLAATLVRAETLLADLQAAHGTPPTQARCLEVRAMLSLLSNLDVLRGALDLAGIAVPPELLRAAAALAAAAEEMVPACEGADAGADVVTTDAEGG